MALRSESVPLVVFDEAESSAAGAGVGDVVDVAGSPVLDDWPSTLIELPPTLTGTEVVTGACAPEATPFCPEVVSPAAGAEAAGAGAAGAGALVPLLDDCPSTLIPFPPRLTGRVIDRPDWSPDAAPSSPLVVAAFAAPTPASDSPPRMTVNHSPLETILFMIVVLLE